MRGDFKLDQVPFEGTLTLHGVEKPVKGLAKVERSHDQATFDAQFETQISDYGIAVPSFAGITIADKVQIEVNEVAPLVLAAASAPAAASAAPAKAVTRAKTSNGKGATY